MGIIFLTSAILSYIALVQKWVVWRRALVFRARAGNFQEAFVKIQCRISTVVMGLFLLFGLVAPALTTPLSAQQVTATVTGTVTDPSGAPVSGATVTITDQDRGTSLTAQTGGDGLYTLSRVSVGNYVLKVEAKGFETAIYPAFTLVLNQVAKVDVQMKVGAVNQTVEVSGNAPILQTETTEVSTIVDGSTNDNLPLATRNPTQLTLLAPGAVSVDAHSFNLGSNTAESGGRPYINGNREQANNFMLDGMDNNQVSENNLGLTPSPDAIQEFNLITSNAPAEFGNFQGGIVNTTIKSGTNQFHGDIFEFFRNDVLNANKWEASLTPGIAPTPKIRWNMFGGTVGGPIIKNKLFFFVDYQGGRFDYPSTLGTSSVLTDAEKGGDFSALLNASTPVQLKNPCAAGTGIVGGTPCQLVAPAAQVNFLNNKIPTNMLDPVFTSLVGSPLYPQAVSSVAATGYGLAYNTTAQQFNTDQGDLKMDYVMSEKDRFSARYSQGYQFDPSSNSQPLLGSSINEAKLYNMEGDWIHAFSPTVINDFRGGLNRIAFANGATTFPASVGDLGTTLGIANSNPNGVPGLLGIGFGGGTITNEGTGSLTNLGSPLVSEAFGSTVVQFTDNLSWITGRHSLKVGFQANRYRIDVFYSGNAGELGALLYSGQYSGNAAADFALGLPGYVGQGISSGGAWHQRDWLGAGYFQDDFRVTSNLTLNLGVRYEARTPWVEENNRQSNINILTGNIELANQDGNSRGLYNSVYGWPDVQPRIGFAWSPSQFDNKAVVRGGYTVSSYLEGTGTNLRLTQNPPFTAPQVEGPNATDAGSTPFTTAAGPTAGSTPVTGNPYAGATINAWDPTVQPAIVQQYNFTVQYEVANNATLQVGYVGQHGTHLMVPEWLTQSILQPNGTTLPTPYVGGPNAAPLTGYGPEEVGAVKDSASIGKMSYNALQAVFQKRYSNGLEGQVSYTYSKCMTNSSGYYGTWSATTQTTPASPYWQNLYNPNAEWSQCYWDSKHVISAYAVYNVPVGSGKKFGTDSGKLVNAIIGDWSLNPIVSWHTGFPLALYSPSDTSGTDSQGSRPNCNGNPVYTKTFVPGAGLSWVSPATFSVPAAGTFGDCPAQGPVIGPAYTDYDLSVQKNWGFGEARKLQFRAEFLNLFNHPNFAHFDNTVGDTNFGVINTTQDAREIQLALKFYF